MRLFSLVMFGLLLFTGRPWEWACFAQSSPPSLQPNAPLKLNQVERLLEIKFEDQLLAREIERRGVAFRVEPSSLERLQKRGLQPLALQALRTQEEAQAYAAFTQEVSDPSKRLALGRAFIQQFPQSTQLPLVKSELQRLEVEQLKSRYQAFTLNPDAARLNQLLQAGQALLKEPNLPEQAGLVTVWLALATARGMVTGIYQELAPSQSWASQAINWLTREPQESDTQGVTAEWRRQSLAELYRAQALYQLRQPNPEPEQVLVWLNRAVQADPEGIGKQSLTIWLRALAREHRYQQALKELARMSDTSLERQAVCANIGVLRESLVDDYMRVVALSVAPPERFLHEEASAALKKFLNTPNPCLTPTVTTETPSTLSQVAPVPQQRARKVKPESARLRTVYIVSKTVYLKSNQVEAALLKRAAFQTGEWRIVRNQKEADYLVEISLPFMTWNWTYELIQSTTSALMAAGKVREATAGLALPKLADELETVFQRLQVEGTAAKGNR